MGTEVIKGIGAGVKEGFLNVFFKLLNGAWSIVAVIIAIMWAWLQLTPEQTVRLLEIEQLFNSWIGIMLMVSIVLSYVASLIGKLKEDIKEIFTNPVHEMICILAAMKEEIANSEKNVKDTLGNIEGKFEKSIDAGAIERGKILSLLLVWKPFFEGK